MSDPVHTTEWLLFYDLGLAGKNAKTRVFGVLPTMGSRPGNWLGKVKWHAPWRRYNFFPAGGESFDPACLRALADFCEDQTNKRKAERRAA